MNSYSMFTTKLAQAYPPGAGGTLLLLLYDSGRSRRLVALERSPGSSFTAHVKSVETQW